MRRGRSPIIPSTYWAKGVVILRLRRSKVVKKSMVRGEEGNEGERTSETPPVKYRGTNSIT